MEFAGAGIIPYEPPTSDLRPFFRIKGLTFFRNLVKTLPTKTISVTDIEQYAEKSTEKIENSEERSGAREKLMKQYKLYVLFGKESIDEKQYIKDYLDMVYGDAASRQKAIEYQTEIIPLLFHPIDTNENGFIEYDEFLKWYEIYGMDNTTAKEVFNTIDVNGDGTISMMEWAYGLTSFHMQCGPDSPLKFWYGPLVEQ